MDYLTDYSGKNGKEYDIEPMFILQLLTKRKNSSYIKTIPLKCQYVMYMNT